MRLEYRIGIYICHLLCNRREGYKKFISKCDIVKVVTTLLIALITSLIIGTPKAVTEWLRDQWLHILYAAVLAIVAGVIVHYFFPKRKISLQETMEIADFIEALKKVQPSAMLEVLIETQNVRWEDIGGLEKAKQALIDARMGVRPPKNILLTGPPGTGKTLLAKAVATESEANFISVKGPEIGESEKAVRDIFHRARMVAPSIVFFDEIDSHITERVLSQLLTEMDGLEKLHSVVVIAATNRPDLLDPALIGRFDRILEVPIPDKEAMLQIFRIHTKNMLLANDVNLEKLAELTGGYVGADIEDLCRETALTASREDINAHKVCWRHFEEALDKVKPTVLAKLILPNNYEIEITEKETIFGREDFVGVVSGDDLLFIGRKHFKILRMDDGMYIVDLNTKNGTKVNGEDIKGLGRRKSKDWDEILVAKVLRVRLVTALQR